MLADPADDLTAAEPAAATVRMWLPGVLREHAAGRSRLDVAVAADATVADVLDALAVQEPGLERRIRDEAGVLRPHVNVYVADTNIRDADGPATMVGGGDISVIPAVSGG